MHDKNSLEVDVSPSFPLRRDPGPFVAQGVPALLLACGLLFAASAGAADTAQQYQQMRSQANRYAAMSLLSFDTDPRPGGSPEQDELQALHEAGAHLREQASRLGLEDPALPGMQGSVEALQRLPVQQAVDYAPLLIAMLDQREQLDAHLDRIYQAQDVAPLARDMNRQSQRIGALRLSALARNARVLGRHTLSQSEERFARLDHEVEQGFDSLLASLPEAQRPPLLRQRKIYRFVRRHLLSPDTLRNSVGAQRYLDELIDWFDEQAAATRGMPG